MLENKLYNELSGFTKFIQEQKSAYELKLKNAESNKNSEANQLAQIDKAKKAAISDLESKILAKREEIKSYCKRLYRLQFAKTAEKHYKNVSIRMPDAVKTSELQYYKSEMEVLMKNLDAAQKDLVVFHSKYKDELGRISQNERQAVKSAIAKLNADVNAVAERLKAEYKAKKEKCAKIYTRNSQIMPSKAGLPTKITLSNVVVKWDDELKRIVGENATSCIVPQEINMAAYGNVFVDSTKLSKANGFARNEMDKLLSGIILSYLESFPYGKVKLTMFNPDVESMESLKSVYTKLFEMGLTSSKDVIKYQSDMRKLIDGIRLANEIIDTKCGKNSKRNIYELYNETDEKEGFNLVVMYDAFSSMTNENIRELKNIVVGSHRTGTRFVFVEDFSSPKLNKESFDEINEIIGMCEKFVLDEKSNAKDQWGRNVILANMAENLGKVEINDIFKEYCKQKEQKVETYLSYESIGFGKEESEGERGYISIPIGKSGEETISVNLTTTGAGGYPIAYLVVGIPRAGKSTLVDTLIMNGAMKYSPDEVEFSVIDFKDGASANQYTNLYVPHMKMLMLSGKDKAQEDAGIVLHNIAKEYSRRYDVFKKTSLRYPDEPAVTNLSQYNELIKRHKEDAHEKLPRQIVIVDECQYLFENDTLTKYAQDIIKQGSGAGIHLVFLIHNVKSSMLEVLNFAAGRFYFAMDPTTVEAVFQRHPEYLKRWSAEIPLGSYSAYETTDEATGRFNLTKMAFSGGDMQKYAKQIKQKWNGYKTNVVIAGSSEPVMVSKDEVLSLIPKSENMLVPFGVNYADRTKEDIVLDGNMLLLSSSNKMIDSVLTSVALSTIKNEKKLYIIDASNDLRVKNVADRLGKKENVVTGNENDFVDLISELYNISNERSQNRRAKHEPIVVIVNSMQFIKSFCDNSQTTISVNRQDNQDALKRSAAYAALGLSSSSSDQKINTQDAVKKIISDSDETNIKLCIGLNKFGVKNSQFQDVFDSEWKAKIFSGFSYIFCSKDVEEDIHRLELRVDPQIINSQAENMMFLFNKKLSTYYKAIYYTYKKDN